jgi:ankyrin repeat protein
VGSIPITRSISRNRHAGTQMKSLLWFGVCLLIASVRCLAAQPETETLASSLAARFAFNRLFGTNACTAESFTKITSDSGRMAIAENYALQDGNVRIEIGSSQFKHAGLSQVDAYIYRFDKVTISRPDLRLCYTIFPQLKAYLLESAPTNSTVNNELPTVRMEDRGEEDAEGHACVKRLAVLTAPSGRDREVLCWFARDLKYFPIRIKSKKENQLETTTFRNIKFARLDHSLFEPPRDFTLCRDRKELMKRWDEMELGAPVISNKTYFVEESIAALIKFTMRSGSNRPISSNAASAFALGSSPIPAVQIALGSKETSLVSIFSVSQVNSNDLFFAQIDQNTRGGTVWLTSPQGKLRAAILTSTHEAARIVPVDRQEQAYEEVRAAFFLASEPPLWEDAPHPLHVAAGFGELSDVEAILKRDEKAINSLDEMEDTPLNCAVVQEREEIADFLLAHGADPNIPNRNGLTPLAQASSRGKAAGLGLAKLLLAHGAQTNPTNQTEFKIPPLEWAISSDNLEVVNLLLAHGASVKSANPNGYTPLHTAANRGDLEIAEALIQHGADVNVANKNGETPLMVTKSPKIAAFLRQHGARE